MKVTSKQNKSRYGIAMTEYLIILAVVAVAAILVVGLFGQQIKNVFSKNTAAMGGQSSGVNTSTTSQNSDKASSQDHMGNFDKNATTTTQQN
jgi:Flp pilus assembly pilin Flp